MVPALQLDKKMQDDSYLELKIQKVNQWTAPANIKTSGKTKAHKNKRKSSIVEWASI